MGDRAAEAAKARAESQSLMHAKIKALRQAKQQQQQQQEDPKHPIQSNSKLAQTSFNTSKLGLNLRITNGRSGLGSSPTSTDSKHLTWFGVEDEDDVEEPEETKGVLSGMVGQKASSPIQRASISSASSSNTRSSWQSQSFDDEEEGTILGHDSHFPAPPQRGSDHSRESSIISISRGTPQSPSHSFQGLLASQSSFSPEDSARASVLLDDLERDLISARDAHSFPTQRSSRHSSNPSISTITSIASSSGSAFNSKPRGSLSSSPGNSSGPPAEPLPSLPTISTSQAQRIVSQSRRSSRSSSPIGPPPSMGLPPLPSPPSSSSISSPINGQFPMDLKRTLRAGSTSSGGSARSSFEGSPPGSSPGTSQISAGRRGSASRSPLSSLPTGSQVSFDSIEEDEDALESVLGMGAGDRYENEVEGENTNTSSNAKKNREMTLGPRTSISSGSSPSTSSPSPSEMSPQSLQNPAFGIGIPKTDQEIEDEKRRQSLMRKSMGSLMNALSDETHRWRRSETGPFGVASDVEDNETETEMGKHGHGGEDEDDDDEQKSRLSARRAEKQRDRENSIGGSSSNDSGSMRRGTSGRPLTNYSSHSGIYDLYSSAAASKSNDSISSLNIPSSNAAQSRQTVSSTSSPQVPNPLSSQPTPIVTVDSVDTSSGSDSDSDRDGPRKRRKAKKNRWAFDDQRAAPSRQGSIASMAPNRSVSNKISPSAPKSDPSEFNYYQFAPDLPPFVPQGMKPRDLTGAGTWQSIVAKAAATGTFAGPPTSPAGSMREGATGHGIHRESAQSFHSTLSLQSNQSLQSSQSAGPVSMRKLAAESRKRQAEQAQALERQASQYSQLSFSPFEIHAHASNATQLIGGSRPESSQSIYSATSSTNSTNFSPPGLSPVESEIYTRGIPAFNVSGHFPSALSGSHFRDSTSELGTMTPRSSTSTLHGLGIDSPFTQPQPQAPPAKVYAEMAQQTSPTSSPPTSPKTSISRLEEADKSSSAVAGEVRQATSLSDAEDTEGERTKSKFSTPTRRQPLRRRSTMGQTETALARQRSSRLSITHNAGDDDQDDLEPSSWSQIKAPRLSSRKSNIGTSPRGNKISGSAFLSPTKTFDNLNRSSFHSSKSNSVYSTASQDDQSSDDDEDDDDGSGESDLDVGTALEDLAEKSGMNFRGSKRKLKEKSSISPSHAPILGSRPISSLPSRSRVTTSNQQRAAIPTATSSKGKFSRKDQSRHSVGWSSSEGEDGDDEERENLGGETTATEIDESEAEQKPQLKGATLPSRTRNGPRPSAPASLSSTQQTPSKAFSKIQNSTPLSASRFGSIKENGVKNPGQTLRKAASAANVSTASWRRSNRAERSRAASPELDPTSQAGANDDDDDDDWLSKDIDETELSRFEDQEEKEASKIQQAESKPETDPPLTEKLQKKIDGLKLNTTDSKPSSESFASPQEIMPSSLVINSSDQTSKASASASATNEENENENENHSTDANSNVLGDSVDSSDAPNSVDLDGTPQTLNGSSWSRAEGSGRNSTATSATSNWSEESNGEGEKGKGEAERKNSSSSEGNRSASRNSGESQKGSTTKQLEDEKTEQVKRPDSDEDTQKSLGDEDEKSSRKPKVKSLPATSKSNSSPLDASMKPMISKLPSPTPRSSLPTFSSSNSKLPSPIPSLSPSIGKTEDSSSKGISTPLNKSIPLPSTPPVSSSVSPSLQTSSKLKPRASMSSGLRQPQAVKSVGGGRPSLPTPSSTSSKISTPTSAIPTASSSSIRKMKSFGDKGSSTFVPPPNSSLPKLDPTARRSSAASISNPVSGRSSPLNSSIPTPVGTSSPNHPPSSWSGNRTIGRKSSVGSLSGSSLPRPSGLPTPKKA